jgi:hypothetical protein
LSFILSRDIYVDVTKETSLGPCLGYNKRKSFALSGAHGAKLVLPLNKRMTMN